MSELYFRGDRVEGKSKQGTNTVEVIRKRLIEVRLENTVVFIETDDNGEFIKAFDINGEPIKYFKGDRKEGMPVGSLKVIQNSPYCICFYTPTGWICIGDCAGKC